MDSSDALKLLLQNELDFLDWYKGKIVQYISFLPDQSTTPITVTSPVSVTVQPPTGTTIPTSPPSPPASGVSADSSQPAVAPPDAGITVAPST